MLLLDTFINLVRRNPYDCFMANLNYYYTPKLYIIFSLLSLCKQFFGEPIHCWTSAERTQAQIDYTNSYCFFDGLRIRPSNSFEEGLIYKGYHWIPYILLSQAFISYIPLLCWNIFNGKEWKYIIDKINVDFQNIHEFIHSKFLHSIKGTVWFLIIKILAIVSIFVNMIILLKIIEAPNPVYSFKNIFTLLSFSDTSISSFPRLTWCIFEIADFNSLYNQKQQCFLPMNIIYEKMYIILFYWSILLLFLSIFDLIYYSITTLSRYRFLKSILNNDDQNIIKRLKNKLTLDMVLLVRFVKNQNGNMAAYSILKIIDEYFQSITSMRTINT
jgi:hypothetical protein